MYVQTFYETLFSFGIIKTALLLVFKKRARFLKSHVVQKNYLVGRISKASANASLYTCCESTFVSD